MAEHAIGTGGYVTTFADALPRPAATDLNPTRCGCELGCYVVDSRPPDVGPVGTFPLVTTVDYVVVADV